MLKSIYKIFTFLTLLLCFTLKHGNAIHEELYDSSHILHTALSSNTPHKFISIDKSIFYSHPNPSIKPSVDWSNIVFMINIYNSYVQDRMIEAHFNTWLRHVGEGLDVVYITDADDNRSFKEILPLISNSKATFHLYKSPAKKEGKHLKFKVIDGFRHVAEKNFRSKKKFFIKMDYDNYLVSERLLNYLNGIYFQTYPKPVHFGRARCFPVCFTEGGFYGFNDIGFSAVVNYFKDNPGIATGEHFDIQDRKMKVSMLAEDFMVSYVYREATLFPLIDGPFVSKRLPIDVTRLELFHYVKKYDGISFHAFKYPNLLYHCESYFYSSNGTMRF